jgi:transcription-repair coupling factor (superfamily II helicase)
MYQGFVDEENQITCYTDHQIFERYHKFSIKNSYSKNKIHYSELTTLAVGDYVTHIDHGIGRFGGLQKIQVENRTQEAIKLVYWTMILFTLVFIRCIRSLNTRVRTDGAQNL